VKSVSRIFRLLLWLFSILFLVAAASLAYSKYEQFTQERVLLPRGSMIAGIPVGGLNQGQTINRLIQAYHIPVELHYADAILQAGPESLGFSLDLTAMLAEAEVQRTSQPVWDAFWDYLWDRAPDPIVIPLTARVDEEKIRAFLKNEVAARYDQAPTAALPVAGTVNYRPGQAGTALEVEPGIAPIAAALRSLSARTVELQSARVVALPPAIQNLQVQLRQLLDLSRYSGIAEVYVQDVQTQQEVNFAYQQGKTIPADIGFTAASTIKIAIMIATFRRTPEPTPQSVRDNLARMIEESDNDASDALMKAMDPTNGPLEVSKDLQALGLKNTFLAGFFHPGAPLLKRFTTPANQRKDYFIDPDPYNQTTPAEIGQLLGDIYQCAADGGGPFSTVFLGEISQNECKQMIDFLRLNYMPSLITAGLPDGTPIAHKHGWVTEMDGLVHSFSDAALITSPGGSYVLTIFLWYKDQLLMDVANPLNATLSSAVYNYFNQVRP
jgi:beta-lactamase class A